ncbi:MAG: SOS response-associated peptidase [Bacteroidetes bacterium]|nr:SOS response-associated peptidase [Bacteroidota bacterium]
MCGRYVAISKVKAIEKRFSALIERPELFTPNTNIGIGTLAPVITQEHSDRIKHYQFGFTPYWAKKPFYLFNARSEGDHNKENNPTYRGAKGITVKPAFRQSIRSKRCLVLADGFIEGPQKERLSKPYIIYKRDGAPFAFAGLYDTWVNPDTGEMVDSFAIITTVSNKITAAIDHHRSPVILNEEDESIWLDPTTPLAEVTDLLYPYPAEELNAYPISAAIKNPRSNGPELLKPVGQRLVTEYDYEIHTHLGLQGMGMTQARQRKLDLGF